MKLRTSGISFANQVLGEQSVANATFEKVRVIGNLHAQDCNYKELKVLGEADCAHCQIDSLTVNGHMQGEACHIKTMDLLGEGVFNQSEIERMRIFGRLCGSNITAAHVCVGTSRSLLSMHGKDRRQLLADRLQGKILENFMPLELNGQRFETIVNAGALYSEQEVECRSFFTFDDVDLHELNADFCYIDPFHRIAIKELHGSLVIIDSGFDPAWLKDIPLMHAPKQLRRAQGRAHVCIDCIEADEVIVDHAQIKLIRTDRITVGPHTDIDRIEYRISCQVHENARVKNTVKV